MAKPDSAKGLDAVAELAERAKNDSIGSIDHAVNAKAIALASDEVQSHIRGLLNRDFQLVAIHPLRAFGSSLMSFPLNFVFRAGAESGPVALNESFIVVVELPTRSVKRISRSADQPAGYDVPFAIAANAQWESPRTPLSAVQPRYRREGAFYRGIGVNVPGWSQNPGEAPNTAVDTLVVTRSDSGSESESGGIADDSWADDDDEDYSYKIDYGNEDVADQGPGGWGRPDPGGGLPPRPGGGGWPWPDPPRPFGGRWRR